MQRKKLLITMSLPMVWVLNGCGGGGSTDEGTTPIPAPPDSTYSVTLSAIDIDRSADQEGMPVTGVPADGATLTVQ